jgi:hypothetical protein
MGLCVVIKIVINALYWSKKLLKTEGDIGAMYM